MLMISIVVQCIGIELLIISIVVQTNRISKLLELKFLMIIILVQCNRIKPILDCIAYDKYTALRLHCL